MSTTSLWAQRIERLYAYVGITGEGDDAVWAAAGEADRQTDR
jgi:hypothetical protein